MRKKNILNVLLGPAVVVPVVFLIIMSFLVHWIVSTVIEHAETRECWTEIICRSVEPNENIP